MKRRNPDPPSPTNAQYHVKRLSRGKRVLIWNRVILAIRKRYGYPFKAVTGFIIPLDRCIHCGYEFIEHITVVSTKTSKTKLYCLRCAKKVGII